MRSMIAAVAALASLSLAVPAPARAAVQTKELTYTSAAGTKLKGFLAWDDAVKEKRPGVLVVHEFWGLNEHARVQARKLAEAGYVGLAIDMYGEGKVATHPEEAKKFVAAARKDAKAMNDRFDAGLALLEKQPQVDPEKTAAFGYCFGGGVALGMARAGRDLDAVAVFHGSLAPEGTPPAAKGKFKPKVVFAALGEADQSIPVKDQVPAFEEEMKAAGVKAEVMTFPGVKHAFTNPDADKFRSEGIAYDEAATKASWDGAMKMMREVFGGT